MNNVVSLENLAEPRPQSQIRLRRFPEAETAHDDRLLSAHGIFKAYRRGNVAVPVLKGVDFTANTGAMTCIVGQSGSGKSTLLHLLATLDKPDEGEIFFQGERIDAVSRKRRDGLRNASIGMIFQFYHLLPELSVLENVLMPSMIGHSFFSYLRNRSALYERARSLLDLVGMSHRLHHLPRELSGGEMQRTAIARALIAEPQLLLADEPTGNLDQQTGGGVLQLLEKLNQENGLTIVMVTHDEKVAERCDRIVRLVEGRVENVS